MIRYKPGDALPLSLVSTTRETERAASGILPSHELMKRAGLAVAQLARAISPHAQTIWIACGPGNNGGDGLEAARVLRRSGIEAVVTLAGDPAKRPADAGQSLCEAMREGVRISDSPPTVLTDEDICIDALLGIGAKHAPKGVIADWLRVMKASPAAILAVDVPTGLDADTGYLHQGQSSLTTASGGLHGLVQSRHHTLALLTLKPGLFMGCGRDAAGTIWFDDLGISDAYRPRVDARLNPEPAYRDRPHHSHKGSFGMVAVLGGESIQHRGQGMTGAALLAARAALCGGAGRVFVGLLDDAPMTVDTNLPELMFRATTAIPWGESTTVCGCGGGERIRPWLPILFRDVQRLVLDADALNALAHDPSLQTMLAQRASRRDCATVITPHPLEAARLLGCDVNEIQRDRLRAAWQLGERLGCTVVLKGSGTVIAKPDRPPTINPTGNGRLATAGTGDVLAGLIGARLSGGLSEYDAACQAVYQHGMVADRWARLEPLTAMALAQAMS